MSEQKKKDKEAALQTWNTEKIRLAKKWIDEEQTQKKRKIVQRGIYLCNLGENIGSEQNTDDGERRPVLVLSNNIINPNDPNALIAPLSKNLEVKIGRDKKPLITKSGKPIPKFGSQYFLYKTKYTFLDYDSAVMTEALRSVSKVRLSKKLGEIDPEDYKIVLAKLKWTTQPS